MVVTSLEEVSVFRDFGSQEYVGVVRPALGKVMVQLGADGREE